MLIPTVLRKIGYLVTFFWGGGVACFYTSQNCVCPVLFACFLCLSAMLRNVEAPTRPRLECRREPGLILRCDRKVGNPFQTNRGVDPPVEIRRVDGAQRKWCRKTSVFLSMETGMPGNFVGAPQGCQVPFPPPIPNVGLLLRRCSGKGLHLG